jgi:hypothetical protein
MKTIFDDGTRSELTTRINSLNQNSTAQWGKMNVHQMLNHCNLWDGMVLQNKKYKRNLIGLVLGRMLLKLEMRDRPMSQNNPTIPEFVIKETTGDFASEKQKWIMSINQYANYLYPLDGFVHPFFGKMSKDQVGYHVYKHSDHHLRQFGN